MCDLGGGEVLEQLTLGEEGGEGGTTANLHSSSSSSTYAALGFRVDFRVKGKEEPQQTCNSSSSSSIHAALGFRVGFRVGFRGRRHHCKPAQPQQQQCCFRA